MAWLFHSIAGLVVDEWACASLIWTSFIDAPSLVRADPRYLNWSTPLLRTFSYSSIMFGMYGRPWIDAADENVAFVGADFHVISSSCFLLFFNEFFEFFFTASQQIDVVGKPQGAERLPSDGHLQKSGSVKPVTPPFDIYKL